jgi:hypothetical protein
MTALQGLALVPFALAFTGLLLSFFFGGMWPKTASKAKVGKAQRSSNMMLTGQIDCEGLRNSKKPLV